MLDKHEVIYQVRTALEVLSAGGVSSGGKIGDNGGGTATSRSFVQEWQRAQAMLVALLQLPAEHNLALMARVQDGNMKFLSEVFAELVSMLWHKGDSPVQKHGRLAVEYLVRRWLVGAGSYREFAAEFDMHPATASVFCKAHVGGMLDDWLTAACGALEPTCRRFVDEELIAA